MILCVCVCVFFQFILDIKFVGRTSRGHTGFLIHLPPMVRALIFIAGRIQPFLSLVDREVEICILTMQSFSTWAFLFLFYFILYLVVRNIPFTGIRTHVPTCQKVTRLLLSCRGYRIRMRQHVWYCTAVEGVLHERYVMLVLGHTGTW